MARSCTGTAPYGARSLVARDDVTRYNLPPDFTKATDTRRAGFVAKYGDLSVELDALPAAVLRSRLVSEIETRLDLDALAEVKRLEQTDRRRLESILDAGAR